MLPRLKDEHPGVREHAVRLAEKLAGSSPAIRERLLAMTDDAELRVRYQLAFSLGELPARPERNVALVKVGQARSGRRLRAGRGAQLAGRRSRRSMRSSWRRTNKFVETKEGREMLASLAAQIGRQQRPEDIAETLQTLTALAKANSPALPTIIQRLAAQTGTPLAEQVAAATGGKAETLMKSLLAAAAKRAADDAAPLKTRVAAVEQLAAGDVCRRTGAAGVAAVAGRRRSSCNPRHLSTLGVVRRGRGCRIGGLSRFAGVQPAAEGPGDRLAVVAASRGRSRCWLPSKAAN